MKLVASVWPIKHSAVDKKVVAVAKSTQMWIAFDFHTMHPVWYIGSSPWFKAHLE